MRWFPVFAIVATMPCVGCSKPAPTTVTVRGVTYEIPKEEVFVAALTPPKLLVVRVAPKGASFDLILDALKPYLPNKQGPNVPTISDLNSNTFARFKVIEGGGGPIVCSLGSRPHFNCGFNVEDGLVKWGVLFDKEQLPKAEIIRQQARQVIQRYRR